MKKIFFLLLLVSSISYGQFIPMLWKIDGAYIVPTDATLKVPTTSLPVGTSANNLVQLNSSAKLPALDASNLINVPVGNVIQPFKQDTTNFSTNSTIFVDIPDMFYSVVANKKYIINLYLYFIGNSVGAYYQFSAPTNSTLGGIGLESILGTSASGYVMSRTINSSTFSILSNKGNNQYYSLVASFILETKNSGILYLQVHSGDTLYTVDTYKESFFTIAELK